MLQNFTVLACVIYRDPKIVWSFLVTLTPRVFASDCSVPSALPCLRARLGIAQVLIACLKFQAQSCCSALFNGFAGRLQLPRLLGNFVSVAS